MSAHEDTTTAPTEDSSPAFPGAEKLPFTPTERSRTNIAPAIEPREGMSAKEHHQSRFGEHTAERVTAHKKAIQIAVKVMPFVGLAFSIGPNRIGAAITRRPAGMMGNITEAKLAAIKPIGPQIPSESMYA